jgi:MFS family permease
MNETSKNAAINAGSFIAGAGVGLAAIPTVAQNITAATGVNLAPLTTALAPALPYLGPVAGGLVYARALKYGNLRDKVETTAMAAATGIGAAVEYGGAKVAATLSSLVPAATSWAGLPAVAGTIGLGAVTAGAGYVIGKNIAKSYGCGNRWQTVTGVAGAGLGALAVPGVAGALTTALAAAPATWGLAAAATTVVASTAPIALPILLAVGGLAVALRAAPISQLNLPKTLGAMSLGSMASSLAGNPWLLPVATGELARTTVQALRHGLQGRPSQVAKAVLG